jgi:hypothetical protein
MGVLRKVVDSFSSAIDNGREVIGTIPADHEHMTKFSGSSDIGFTRIAATLTRWINDIKKQKERVILERT